MHVGCDSVVNTRITIQQCPITGNCITQIACDKAILGYGGLTTASNSAATFTKNECKQVVISSNIGIKRLTTQTPGTDTQVAV